MGDEKKQKFDWTSQNVSDQHVEHLRNLHQTDFVNRYKAFSHRLLDIQHGHHVLDVGCGLGDDAATMAESVGVDGQVIGIDASATMIEQAVERHGAKGLPLRYEQMDAKQMSFADNTFDAARTDRVLQHIPDVGSAISEITRVLKPGGRLVSCETDWDSLTIDVGNRNIFRRVRSHLADDGIRNGWMGRSLYGLLVESGMVNVSIQIESSVFTDYGWMQRWRVWHDAVQKAQDDGVISADDAREHLNDLDTRAAAGKHLFAISIFIVKAYKPG